MTNDRWLKQNEKVDRCPLPTSFPIRRTADFFEPLCMLPMRCRLSVSERRRVTVATDWDKTFPYPMHQKKSVRQQIQRPALRRSACLTTLFSASLKARKTLWPDLRR